MSTKDWVTGGNGRRLRPRSGKRLESGMMDTNVF
jgi:hypothetical protein